MKKLSYIFSLIYIISACGEKEIKVSDRKTTPNISNNGTRIYFPDAKSSAFIKTEKISSNKLNAELNAVGRVVAIVLPSEEIDSQKIVLFDNPELAENYAQLLQHEINIRQIQNISIKQKQIELERIKDLHLHGAATGQDLLNAQTALSIEQTNLANEKAALIEHETKLRAEGLNPETLRKAQAGTAFIICHIPENLINKIKIKQACNITFTAFPNENFTGKIDAIADMVDNNTRMVKVRITINDSGSKLKSGMFANIFFDFSEENFISINKNSLVTVQGKNYVFIKKSTNEFERKEIQTGQQIGDRVIVYSGLNEGDEIVTGGVMQLKGLSFGY